MGSVRIPIVDRLRNFQTGVLLGHSYKMAFLWLAFLLASCGNTGAEQQTLDAHEMGLGTSVISIQQEANARSQRLQATLDYAETQVARAATQQQYIVNTLEGRGMVVVLPAAATARPVSAPPNSNSPGSSNSSPDQSLPQVQVTPFTPTPEPVEYLLRSMVMATGVDNNDCAIGVTNQFMPSNAQIYVVALATELQNGTTVVSRWMRGDEELARFDHTFGYIEDACIWFYADQTDFEFVPGQYQVILEINGELAAPPATFTIVEG